MMMTCVLLGISGGVRYCRDWHFQKLVGESTVSPFPLKDLPKKLGSWETLDGSEKHLDPEVALIAGSSDHIQRLYRDANGEQVLVLILYGLGRKVSQHTPDVCYPASGWRLVSDPVDRELKIPDIETPVRFRSAFYTKKLGAIWQYEEVFYTFSHDGQWLPDVGTRWKAFRYVPGVYKIQLQRNVNTIGLTQDSPCESLLKELTREINSRELKNKRLLDQGTLTQFEFRTFQIHSTHQNIN
jgi:hypothetical protein